MSQGKQKQIKQSSRAVIVKILKDYQNNKTTAPRPHVKGKVPKVLSLKRLKILGGTGYRS